MIVAGAGANDGAVEREALGVVGVKAMSTQRPGAALVKCTGTTSPSPSIPSAVVICNFGRELVLTGNRWRSFFGGARGRR